MASHFKDAINLLTDLLDYGTSLIPRAYTSSPKDLKAICVLFVQLRQFLEHLDGVATLLAAGSAGTANLQLRSLLETSHAMEWLLKSDTEAKVNHLYVANLRQRRHWQSMAIPGTTQAARHAAATGALSLTPDQLKEITDEVAGIDRILGTAPFDAINAKFEPHYQARNFDDPWYKVYGAASIRKIADELGKLKEYTYIYSPFSGVTHGSDMWKNIVVGDQNLQVNPLRQPQHIPGVVRLGVSFALHVYRLVLQEYRPAEEENFNRKYVAQWRAEFLREYKVELTPREIVI
jgi:hypothetical protein